MQCLLETSHVGEEEKREGAKLHGGIVLLFDGIITGCACRDSRESAVSRGHCNWLCPQGQHRECSERGTLRLAVPAGTAERVQ